MGEVDVGGDSWIAGPIRGVWIMENGPESAFTSLVWYSLVGTAEHWGWEFDDEGHFFQFGVTR